MNDFRNELPPKLGKEKGERNSSWYSEPYKVKKLAFKLNEQGKNTRNKKPDKYNEVIADLDYHTEKIGLDIQCRPCNNSEQWNTYC